MITQQDIATEWDRIAEMATARLRRPFPLFDQINFSFDNATSRLIGVREAPFGRFDLRISRRYLPPAMTHDLIIALTHEMAHIGDLTHGKKWQRDFKIMLNGLGYTKHPVSTGYVPYSAADHPSMPILLEHEITFERTEGWMYYCNCPTRTAEAGGYGVRSRRSLEGRICKDCGVLHVQYIRK